jgi:phage shock protein A
VGESAPSALEVRNTEKEYRMALLERVATLIRANLNELVERAESPEKMIKQIILDMQNQFMQVKTQVAIALADLHLLEKKQQENKMREEEWMRKAQLAVSKGDDRLARAGLDRAMSYKQLAADFADQIEDQKAQVEVLKEALNALARKISETEGQADVLIAQHRRAKAVGRAADASQKADSTDKAGAFHRMSSKVMHEEAVTQAAVELSGEDIARRFEKLEREQEIERMLQELKQRKGLTA